MKKIQYYNMLLFIFSWNIYSEVKIILLFLEQRKYRWKSTLTSSHDSKLGYLPTFYQSMK